MAETDKITLQDYKNAERIMRIFERQEQAKMLKIAERKKAGYTPELLSKDANLSAWLANRLIKEFDYQFFEMRIKDLANFTAEQLLNIPTFGKKCLREVNNLLFLSELPQIKY